MKKGLLFIAAIAFTFSATAQLTSKKGEIILPEEGDYAIGFNAAPFLNYAGNFFSQAGNFPPTAAFVFGDLTITGKKFVAVDRAYRARVRVGLNSSTSFVVTNDSTLQNPVIKTDKIKSSSTNITLGGGMEHRHGSTRIQGFCGYEGLVMLTSAKTDREYETDFSGTSRLLSNKTGMGFGFTARGFVGVEMFIFPKTSLALEYGVGLGYMYGGKTSSTFEFADGSETEVQTGQRANTFGLDNDNTGGAISLLFHF